MRGFTWWKCLKLAQTSRQTKYVHQLMILTQHKFNFPSSMSLYLSSILLQMLSHTKIYHRSSFYLIAAIQHLFFNLTHDLKSSFSCNLSLWWHFLLSSCTWDNLGLSLVVLTGLGSALTSVESTLLTVTVSSEDITFLEEEELQNQKTKTMMEPDFQPP